MRALTPYAGRYHERWPNADQNDFAKHQPRFLLGLSEKEVDEAEQQDLPEGWERHLDDDGPYYWHIRTGTIQRERPREGTTRSLPTPESRPLLPPPPEPPAAQPQEDCVAWWWQQQQQQRRSNALCCAFPRLVRDSREDFAYVARDSGTRRFMCHVFRCDMPARIIANALRDVCKKMVLERSLSDPSGDKRSAPAEPPARRVGSALDRLASLSMEDGVEGGLLRPMEEPRKVLRALYLGSMPVAAAAGIDLLNGAIDTLLDRVPRAHWLPVQVAVAPSTVTVTLDPAGGGRGQVLAECRVRFLSFLGIGKEVTNCGFIMHTAQDQFEAHVLHCEPSAGALCKTIEAACKLRYQKCLDAHRQANNSPPPQQQPTKPLRALRQSQWKERLVIRCLERGIAVYSPHTAWDAVDGGANDWLASCLGSFSSTEPVTTDGAGRRVRLEPPVPLEELAARLRTHVGAPKVRLALATRHTVSSAVSRVSLCAGSGVSVLRDDFGDAELVVTGEMSHHDILDATQRGASVLLCEHAVSERGSLGRLAARLSREASALCVVISKADTGPLQLV
ncbi:hypothetical protein HPB50_004933 [Hyalomma asiaticum]|uniref:Uncharacterized protein n=1 Tax=Hyalomma asiaticum TaxID=266040 RepID=A0ACB7SMT3_HYAAI|nr:hypothetical protein HPB50_004933 [Hyalomma asiaticum]